MATFFFCGIGGIGMSAIALYLKQTGHCVIGSDRSFDQGHNKNIRSALISNGISIVPQTGEGVTAQIDILVVSSAIEDSIPDVKKAKELNIPIQKRAEVLASIFHKHKQSVAVAGTSGKTTVTAMIAHILHTLKKDPTMINGGISLNTYNNNETSNLIYGKSELCVIEADESDGSIALYNPYISILTNISLDHKPISEIRPLFSDFLNRTQKGIVINADCLETETLPITNPNIISFSIQGKENVTLNATDITHKQNQISFSLNNKTFSLPVIGKHNLENALAAIGVCLHLDISIEESITALQSFAGTKRRLQTIGTAKNICIIDDYAHNVEKIKATLTALQQYKGRIFAIYQPHGFAPLRLMKEDLIKMLSQTLNSQIVWVMLPVFYAGGTVQKTISSQDIITPLQENKKQAFYATSRDEAIQLILPQLKENDRIVIMGARDDTLTDYAVAFLNTISKTPLK